jgi:hypothetical protein
MGSSGRVGVALESIPAIVAAFCFENVTVRQARSGCIPRPRATLGIDKEERPMNDKLIDGIAQMWATHPEAATRSLHWATIEQQLDADGDKESLVVAQEIRSRAAELMKAKVEA